MHAVDRLRRLFAEAIGYALPGSAPDYGLAPGLRPAAPRLLLLHGATWESKRWPETYWSELARRALAAGIEPVLRWHDQAEHDSAQRIAAGAPGTGILAAADLAALRKVIARPRLVHAQDSRPAHLAAARAGP